MISVERLSVLIRFFEQRNPTPTISPKGKEDTATALRELESLRHPCPNCGSHLSSGGEALMSYMSCESCKFRMSIVEHDGADILRAIIRRANARVCSNEQHAVVSDSEVVNEV